MTPAPAARNQPLWDERALIQPHEQVDKARRVQGMFDAIAPTYERVNKLSSLGRDRYWRRRAVEVSGVRRTDAVLDVACGTGDLSRAFAEAGAGRVVGADFAGDMLRLASARGAAGMGWCQSDALALPFRSESFDIASCAFGVRNFQDLGAGLREMFRVLRPGGRCVILEFSMPRGPLLRRLYGFYIGHVLPRIAGLVSGDRTGAYRYLPRSIMSFVDVGGMEQGLEKAGFTNVRRLALTLGVVHILVATKGPGAAS